MEARLESDAQRRRALHAESAVDGSGRSGRDLQPGAEQLDFLGRDGYPRSGRDLRKNNWGPRLGPAWRIGEDTVVRSGYGLVWIELAGITTPFINPQFPFLQTVTQRTLDNLDTRLHARARTICRALANDA